MTAPGWLSNVDRVEVRELAERVIGSAFTRLNVGTERLENLRAIDTRPNRDETIRAGLEALIGTAEDIQFFRGAEFDFLVSAMLFDWREIDDIRATYFRRARFLARALAKNLRQTDPARYAKAFAKWNHHRCEARLMEAAV